MSAGRYDLEIEQGATWSRVLEYQDPEGDAIDLSTYTARMMIRTTYDAATPLVALTTENGRITIDGLAGRITLNLSATDTAALPAGLHVYDVELVVGAVVDRLIAGRARVSPEATK
jgi:tRNA threonylcarbamoyladenosine modification (KEOPS) complex  Pcc1 subunit